jgi:uncharacterized protein
VGDGLRVLGFSIARSNKLLHQQPVKRDLALARLKPFEPRLRQRGINALYLFGSTARDEAGDSSDVDLLFEYDPTTSFSLFDQAGLMIELSDSLGSRVDLISRMGLRPRVKARVENEMVRVF